MRLTISVVLEALPLASLEGKRVYLCNGLSLSFAQNLEGDFARGYGLSLTFAGDYEGNFAEALC